MKLAHQCSACGGVHEFEQPTRSPEEIARHIAPDVSGMQPSEAASVVLERLRGVLPQILPGDEWFVAHVCRTIAWAEAEILRPRVSCGGRP